MKLFRNPDRLFLVLVMFFAVVLGPFSTGVEGQKWMEAYRPFAQFFVGIIMICFGPWLIGIALEDRDSEGTVTVWKKTWPVKLALGILAPLGGVATLWELFVK
jgi:hypothetical protein